MAEINAPHAEIERQLVDPLHQVDVAALTIVLRLDVIAGGPVVGTMDDRIVAERLRLSMAISAGDAIGAIGMRAKREELVPEEMC